MESKIRQAAQELKDKFNCVSYKMETEAEGLVFAEISERINLLGGVLPITIKIGGPEARGDMRTCIGLGVDGLTAPMVESEYGLRNFIDALEAIASPKQFGELQKGVNIETKTAYANLSDIINSPHLKKLDQFSVGRSDLSSSLGETVDSPRMYEIVRDIAERGKAAGLLISVGGNVNPANVNNIIERVRPDKVNTRNLVFKVKGDIDYPLAIKKALLLEIAILEWKKNIYSDFVRMMETRIKVLKSRLEI